MYWLLALLAGLSAKYYDDVKDNIKLKQFKNKYALEISKLFHMGAFVHITFHNPLFFYIISIVMLFGLVGDTSCYKCVYERCLFISILLFLPFLDNSKLQMANTTSIIYIIILILVTGFGAYFESKIIKEEYSYRKLSCRIGGLLWTLVVYLLFPHNYETMTLIQMYVVGYLSFSVIVQIYCLFFQQREKQQQPLLENLKLKSTQNFKDIINRVSSKNKKLSNKRRSQ